MSFLTPLFLAGLAALAIPVLIHLIQREKKQVVEFPSLMFIRRIPYQSVRRRHIHNWALLMLRLAALALIVAAFARPFLPHAAPTLDASGAREVVILLDRSYSMEYGDHWDRARAAARDVVNALAPTDRASIVLFASTAEVALRSTSDRGRLLAAIATAEPSAGATRYGPALKVAASILGESPLPRRETILITDFQRNGWQGADGVRLPDGATLTPVSVAGARDATNVAVTAVSLERSTFADQERVTVTAGVLNRSSRPVSGLEMTLDVGGRAVQTERVNVDANGSASLTFAPFTLASRDVRGTVHAAPDALARDNAFHFVVSRAEPVRVLLVERGGTGGASLYLTRALAIGDAPRFDVLTRQADAVSSDDLQRANVVVLNDVAVTSALADRLARFVEGGRGLFVALGPRAAWPSAVDVLPAAPAMPVDRSKGDAARVGALEYGHPVFELFRAPRSGDFSTARVYGYRSVVTAAGRPEGRPLQEKSAGNGSVGADRQAKNAVGADLPPSREASADRRGGPPGGGPPASTGSSGREATRLGGGGQVGPGSQVRSDVQILARFDGGAPALLERKVDRGRVLMWTSTLDLFWNDLALKPVFLPFVHRVVRHLAAYAEPAPWLTVGQVLDPAAGGAPSSPVALTPSGRRVPLDAEGSEVLELVEQGFYEIRGQARDSEPAITVASNVDLSESDLTPLDPREVVAAAVGRAGGAAGQAVDAELTPEAQERTQRVWWYLMCAGILLLGVETLLSNRLSKV